VTVTFALDKSDYFLLTKVGNYNTILAEVVEWVGVALLGFGGGGKMNERRVRKVVLGMAKVALLLDLVKTWKKHLPEDDFQKLQNSAIQDSILLQEALEKALGILTEIAVEFFPGISPEILHNLHKWSRDTIELLKEFPEIRELEAMGALLLFGGYIPDFFIVQAAMIRGARIQGAGH
jgi:hypothetical protein